MSLQRPFRFGVNIFGTFRSAQELCETAQKAENLGFSTFGIGDHIDSGLGPLTALAAAATVTKDVRIGTLVLGNDFRHPAILAKEIATLDLLSNGRVEFGLGTGWSKEDYVKPGISLDPPTVRIQRFEEALKIIKGLFGDQSVNYTGRYYQITDMTGTPKPIQRPYPPIVIGGGGKRMLSIAAREADIVSVNILTTADGQLDLASSSAAATDQKIAWVRQAAGDRFGSLELNILLLAVLITSDPHQALADWLAQWGMTLADISPVISVDELIASPHMLIGTQAEVIEKLQAQRERFGISYYTIFGEDQIDRFAPIVARLAGT